MRRIIAIAVLLLTAAPALAQSNIGLTQYPAPKCEVPPAADVPEPRRPTSENPTEAQAALYNRQVREYNAAMRAHNDGARTYAACVEGYIAAAKADIERIQSAVNAAVAMANRQ